MADSRKPGGLGRGLSALMADVPAEPDAAPPQPDRTVPVERLAPNPDQPRRRFDTAALSDLAASIKARGIIQPLIVRPYPGSDGAEYQIVAGERRWRAAQLAGLHEVPVLVREFSDTEVLEVAIIENIQRADLNPVDEAEGYRRLIERHGHTQEQLSDVLGKSRSHIANHMRLLSLPEEVLGYLAEGRLTAGHARALITAPAPAELARKVIQRQLSVRQTESLAKSAKGTTGKQRKRPAKDADTQAIEAELSAALGTRATITPDIGKESGTLSLRYRDLDQLDDFLRALSN